MPLTLEDSVHIGAPAESVWRLLADPASWRFWWPHCSSAEAADRRPLRDGSRLEISLQPGLVPYTVRAEVEVAQPGRALIWRATTFGTRGRHAFYLEPRPNGTRVRESGTYEGNLLLFRLLRRDVATAKMFHGNLRGLKRAAERGI